MTNTLQNFGIAGVFFAEPVNLRSIGWSSAATSLSIGGGHEVIPSANSAGLQLEGYIQRSETTVEVAGISDGTSRLEARLRGGTIVDGHDSDMNAALRALYPIGPGAGWKDARFVVNAANGFSAAGLYALRRSGAAYRLYRVFTGAGSGDFGGGLSDATDVTPEAGFAFTDAPGAGVEDGDTGFVFIEDKTTADATAHDFGSMHLPKELSLFALSRGAAAGVSGGNNLIRYYVPRFQPSAFDDAKEAGAVNMFTLSGVALFDPVLGGTHEISFSYGLV